MTISLLFLKHLCARELQRSASCWLRQNVNDIENEIRKCILQHPYIQPVAWIILRARNETKETTIIIHRRTKQSANNLRYMLRVKGNSSTDSDTDLYRYADVGSGESSFWKMWEIDDSKLNLPTTCKYPNCVLAVTVFIWHMYRPWSSSFTLLMCKNHVRCLSCLSWVTLMRGFRVITWLCTVNMADCSKCIHATYAK